MRKSPAGLVADLLSVALPVALALIAGNAALSFRAEAADPVAPYKVSPWTQDTMPIRYWLDSRFTDSEAAALRAAFAQWEHDSKARVTFRYIGTITATGGSSDDGRNVVVRSADALPRGRGETIATTRRHPSGERGSADADIVIDFSGSVHWSTTGEATKYDLQSVAAHEVGHLLGLDDVGDPGQLMCWMSRPGELNKHYVGFGDLEGLALAYPFTVSPGE